MKINWGTGIVMAFIAFIAFILYFVFQASSDPKADHDMVTKEYYKKELDYQKELDAAANLTKFGGNVAVTKMAEGLRIDFPKGMDAAKIRGKVSLYRPSNEQLDFEIPIEEFDSLLLIPSSRLLDGRWDIRLDWTSDGVPYLYRGRFTY